MVVVGTAALETGRAAGLGAGVSAITLASWLVRFGARLAVVLAEVTLVVVVTVVDLVTAVSTGVVGVAVVTGDTTLYGGGGGGATDGVTAGEATAETTEVVPGVTFAVVGDDIKGTPPVHKHHLSVKLSVITLQEILSHNQQVGSYDHST